jgi:hypothetical protein
MRIPLGIIALLVCLLAVPVQASAKFHYTHTVSATGSIVDNWTVADPEDCASQGAGNVSVSYESKGRIRIRPLIDKFAGRPHSKKPGSWVLAVPGGGGITHLGRKPATGTSTHTDNTVQNPQDSMTTSPCLPADKSACGTTAVKKGSFSITSLDMKTIAVAFDGEPPLSFNNGCLNGALESWQFPQSVVGGSKIYGEVILKMPSMSALRHKHSVTISGSVHQTSAGPRSENGPVMLTDDVTRTVSVTFTKL